MSGEQHRTAAGNGIRALRPVSNGARREEIAETIRRGLLTRELTPGQRINAAELAATLNVSRPTLRKALHQLIHEGALVQESYKGIRVAQTSPQALLDVTEVRVSLETMAAIRLADNPSGPGLARLRRALEKHEIAVKQGNPATSDFTHLEFHRTIWLTAGNAMLARIWPLVGAQMRMAMAVDRVRDAPERDLELHERLVDVIDSGDPGRIRAEVDRHIRTGIEELVRIMQETENKGEN